MPLRSFRQPVKAVITDVIASRAIGTIYQNTSGRPKLAIIGVDCSRASGTVLYAYIQAFVENVTPPTVIAAWAGLATQTNLADRVYDTIVIAIPNQSYYRVSSFVGAGCAVTLQSWIEVEL